MTWTTSYLQPYKAVWRLYPSSQLYRRTWLKQLPLLKTGHVGRWHGDMISKCDSVSQAAFRKMLSSSWLSLISLRISISLKTSTISSTSFSSIPQWCLEVVALSMIALASLKFGNCSIAICAIVFRIFPRDMRSFKSVSASLYLFCLAFLLLLPPFAK